MQVLGKGLCRGLVILVEEPDLEARSPVMVVRDVIIPTDCERPMRPAASRFVSCGWFFSR